MANVYVELVYGDTETDGRGLYVKYCVLEQLSTNVIQCLFLDCCPERKSTDCWTCLTYRWPERTNKHCASAFTIVLRDSQLRTTKCCLCTLYCICVYQPRHSGYSVFSHTIMKWTFSFLTLSKIIPHLLIHLQ